MADDALRRWDYALVDVDYLSWWDVDKPKKRADKKLDPEVHWESLVIRSPKGLKGLWGVWVAWDPGDGYGRPPLAVLQSLGRNGREVVGVQTTGLSGGSESHPISTYVLKRPLSDSAGE